jgi:predicted regulator of Ras-like GTPase activity (Roadblock/LC7/MglB family)
MDNSLQSLLDLAGVNAAMVYDGAGRLVAQRGKAVYDRALCEQVGGPLSKAVDSIQLQHEDWEAVTARFADGTVILRNLGDVEGASYVLAVVADATLNPAFAAVALRVAANKARKALEVSMGLAPASASASSVSSSQVAPLGARPSSSQVLSGSSVHPASGSRPVLANSGLSWSRATQSGFSTVMAADPASAAFLARTSKELARYVGPMAKVYVEEAARRISPDLPFSLALARTLCEELAGQIEDGKERDTFLKAATAGT